MSGSRSQKGHGDLGPELRQLAQAVLDRLDPAVRAAATAAAARGGEGPGRCQQVWCPVCALAALVKGEEHPLLTVVAEHSVALLSVIRMMLDGAATQPGSPAPTPDPPDGRGPGGGAAADESEPPAGASRYQPIPVIVEE